MENLGTSVLVGAAGGINGGLLALGALEKLQALGAAAAYPAIAAAVVLGAAALIGLVRATVGMLSEPVEVPLV